MSNHKERFFGVGEPLIQRENDQGIRAEKYLDLVKGLGCNAYRSWMHLTEILRDPVTPDEKALEQQGSAMKKQRGKTAGGRPSHPADHHRRCLKSHRKGLWRNTERSIPRLTGSASGSKGLSHRKK